jgi:ATP phosphoribosyltransferase
MEHIFFPFSRASNDLVLNNSAEKFDEFAKAKVRIALQKDGELTALSIKFLTSLGVSSPEDILRSKRLIHVVQRPSLGVLLTKNKAIGGHIAEGRVDCAIVGQDRLIEEGLEEDVEQIHVFDDYKWPIVLALPRRVIECGAVPELKRIATQYPRIAERGFRRLGMDNVEIIPTFGGTEAYPYIIPGCDGIVDMTVSGQSLEAHDLVSFDPPLEVVSPVLVARREKAEIVRRIITRGGIIG